MKIIVLSSHTPSLFWFRMDMMKSFINLGHDVVAVGNEPNDKWDKMFADSGITYRQIYVQRNGMNPLNDFKTLKEIRSILMHEKPDRVFAYQAKTVIYGGIAAKQLGITEMYSMIAGVGSIFISSGIKNKLIKIIMSAEYRFSLKNNVKVFFQNSDDSNIFIQNRILSEEKIVYINGSGVNLDFFSPAPVPEHPCFLFIGRLIRDKGIIEYLEACKKVKSINKNIRCMLVGPYDTNPTALTEKELSAYIDSGIVEYFGEQADVRPYLEKCSVFVLPSYHEGTPKSVLEAMASGRAVITTDAPGCRETVQNGINGYLVPIKNSEELAMRMIELANNREISEQMGRSGRILAEEKYDVRIVNKCIIDTMKI